MKKWLFLIAWMDGSDEGGANGVHTQNDLYPQHQAGNEHVTAFEIEADTKEVAYEKGYKEAFFENYTAYNSFSVLIDLETGKEV